jgi:hypothetical protein
MLFEASQCLHLGTVSKPKHTDIPTCVYYMIQELKIMEHTSKICFGLKSPTTPPPTTSSWLDLALKKFVIETDGLGVKFK